MSSVDIDPAEYSKVLDLLKKIDFFEGVPEPELKTVLLSLQKEKFAKSKTILFQGEIANRLFIVRDGSVVITTKNKGQKMVLAELKSPSYFGEISLLRPMSATATATSGDEGADLIILTHDSMSRLSKKIPDIEARIQKVIENRIANKKKLKEAEEASEQS